MNGCGPAWMPSIFKKALFNWFFEASCDKHDEGYDIGGDEVRRFECDWRFWQAMKRDALRYKGPVRVVCYVTAIVYFLLVRAFGWTRYEYK